MSSVVLLGAGLGARLRPHTDDRPKCVVELAGEPLAVRLLRQLAERGVDRATVVLGHFAERARAVLETHLRHGPALRTVMNHEYDRTNTMYSLYLAMAALADGGFVVEGDVIASDQAIEALVATAASAPARSWWAAEAWNPTHSGCRLTTDGTGRLVEQEIWRAATLGAAGPGRRWWKSAGMLYLTAADARRLAELLERACAADQRGLYYDDVIGAELREHGPDALSLHVLDLGAAPWMEIDDAGDLAAARALFEPAPARSAAR